MAARPRVARAHRGRQSVDGIAMTARTTLGAARTQEVTDVFHSDVDPSAALSAELAAHAPANPFCRGEYLAAIRILGYEPWLLTLRRNGRVVAGCVARLRRGALNRSLDIPSHPAVNAE